MNTRFKAKIHDAYIEIVEHTGGSYIVLHTEISGETDERVVVQAQCFADLPGAFGAFADWVRPLL